MPPIGRQKQARSAWPRLWIATEHLAEMDGIKDESRADLVEVGMIQNIRGLNTELNALPLIKVSGFEQ